MPNPEGHRKRKYKDYKDGVKKDKQEYREQLSNSRSGYNDMNAAAAANGSSATTSASASSSGASSSSSSQSPAQAKSQRLDVSRELAAAEKSGVAGRVELASEVREFLKAASAPAEANK